VGEKASSDGYSTSDGEDSASNHHHGAAGQGNITLLQDSKFSANRTDLRIWHELRYVRCLWSREEEDQLRSDCLGIIDAEELQSTSNAILWTASFDRYGVPLSDIFTYGLRPHPRNLRLTRKKLLSPQFCDHLTTVMIHPIFQGDAALLRYVLQLLICKRVGIHVPPMGTMPDMDNASLDKVRYLADTLLLDEDTPETRLVVHADAYLFLSQEHGVRIHPDIVMLEDLLSVEFSKEGLGSTMPQDDAPNSRSLFYLQLWDLRFLLDVLNGLSVGSCYLTVESYKNCWLKDTFRIQNYISNKLDSLIHQYFVRDERNYRIRQKLKQKGSDARLYDIPEEDFNPTYAHSQYVTHRMRAVLEGDYLEGPIAASSADEDSVDESLGIGDEEESGSGTDVANSPISRAQSLRGSPARSVAEEAVGDTTEEEHSGNTTGEDIYGDMIVATAHEEPQPSSDAKIKLEAQDDLHSRIDYQKLEAGKAYDGDVEDTEDDKEQVRSGRESSFVSIQSVTSSKAADDQQWSNYSSFEQGYFPRRGLPPLNQKAR
jgi:hypothetical protein